jgi:hypothetical protein
MTSIIVIEKNGTPKNKMVRSLSREVIYKKCGFKTPHDFKRIHSWLTNRYNIDTIELWASTFCKQGQENTFQLPPLLNKNVYYGNMALIAFNEKDEMIDFKLETWNILYPELYKVDQAIETKTNQDVVCNELQEEEYILEE